MALYQKDPIKVSLLPTDRSEKNTVTGIVETIGFSPLRGRGVPILGEFGIVNYAPPTPHVVETIETEDTLKTQSIMAYALGAIMGTLPADRLRIGYKIIPPRSTYYVENNIVLVLCNTEQGNVATTVDLGWASQRDGRIVIVKRLYPGPDKTPVLVKSTTGGRMPGLIDGTSYQAVVNNAAIFVAANGIWWIVANY